MSDKDAFVEGALRFHPSNDNPMGANREELMAFAQSLIDSKAPQLRETGRALKHFIPAWLAWAEGQKHSFDTPHEAAEAVAYRLSGIVRAFGILTSMSTAANLGPVDGDARTRLDIFTAGKFLAALGDVISLDGDKYASKEEAVAAYKAEQAAKRSNAPADDARAAADAMRKKGVSGDGFVMFDGRGIES